MKRTLLFSGLFGLSALMLPARSPSGFDDGVDVWFRTAPVSSNLQGRYLWSDFAGDSLSLYAYNRTAGTYVFTQDKSLLKFLNFNPKAPPRSGATFSVPILRKLPLSVCLPLIPLQTNLSFTVSQAVTAAAALSPTTRLCAPARLRRLTMEIPKVRICGIRARIP